MLTKNDYTLLNNKSNLKRNKSNLHKYVKNNLLFTHQQLLEYKIINNKNYKFNKITKNGSQQKQLIYFAF